MCRVQRHTVLFSCTHTFYCLAAAVWNADFMHFIHFVQLGIAQFSSAFVSSPFELHTSLVLVSTKYYKNKKCILYTPKEIAVDLLRLSKPDVLCLEVWCPSCHREQCASEISGCLVPPSSYSHFLLHMLTVIAALGAGLGTMGQKCLFTANNHCQGRKNCFEMCILSLSQIKFEIQTIFGL